MGGLRKATGYLPRCLWKSTLYYSTIDSNDCAFSEFPQQMEALAGAILYGLHRGGRDREAAGRRSRRGREGPLGLRAALARLLPPPLRLRQGLSGIARVRAGGRRLRIHHRGIQHPGTIRSGAAPDALAVQDSGQPLRVRSAEGGEGVAGRPGAGAGAIPRPARAGAARGEGGPAGSARAMRARHRRVARHRPRHSPAAGACRDPLHTVHKEASCQIESSSPCY
jgi:hypothetical protein